MLYHAIDVNPLQEHWHGNVWVAPKGAVRDCRMWLNKTISEYRNGYINSFVFSSAAHLSYSELPLLSGTIPFVFRSNVSSSCVLRPKGFESVSPSTWNLLMYGPPIDQALTDIDKVSLFYNTFRDVGRVIYSEYAGDNWSKDLEFYEENKGNI